MTGYGWSGGDDSGPGLGWIDFNPNGDDGIRNNADDHCTTGVPAAKQYKAASCDTPNGENPGVVREGDLLKGWARIVEIAKESANGNSGGWTGWIHMNGSYGIGLTRMTGDQTIRTPADVATKMTFATAGADELGWMDASRAKICTNPNCSTKIICAGNTLGAAGSNCDSITFCSGDTGATCKVGADQISWTCTNSCGSSSSCSATINPKVDGSCGSADGGSFCAKTPTDAELCQSGTSVPGASSIKVDAYQVSWQCQGSCGGSTDDCSAKGKKACGWIETNP